LQLQLTKLQIVAGKLPVHGPGVQLTVAFKLRAFELQDLSNSLRQLSAEAVQVNGHRITARTVFADKGSAVTIDGEQVNAPFTILAIGDPQALSTGAQDLVSQLSPRGSVTLNQEADVQVTAVAPQRPVVYSVRPGGPWPAARSSRSPSCRRPPGSRSTAGRRPGTSRTTSTSRSNSWTGGEPTGCTASSTKPSTSTRRAARSFPR
jgi:hypothetical protein